MDERNSQPAMTRQVAWGSKRKAPSSHSVAEAQQDCETASTTGPPLTKDARSGWRDVTEAGSGTVVGKPVRARRRTHAKIIRRRRALCAQARVTVPPRVQFVCYQGGDFSQADGVFARSPWHARPVCNASAAGFDTC